ncbi:MAG: GNAT superfamily N-acetyltransferase [Ancylomarina sp.]|jgi:GNAT superfamily N-acetyltransferase
METPNQNNRLSFQALNSSNFEDFEYLFKEKGVCEGCWCMQCRLPADEFEANKGNGNRLAMKALVESGQIPGIIAYNDTEPVGWCSLGDREDFPRLPKSHEMKIIDEQTWIISCLYIRKGWRRRGIKRALLKYLIAYCQTKGAHVLESHQCNSNFSKYPDNFAWTGIEKAYEAVGFVKVDKPSDKRPIMRYHL